MCRCIKNVIWIVFSIVLYPLSLLYWLITYLRNVLYDKQILKSYTLPGKVISIGNIDVGGTGKTPVCIKVAKFLEDKNYKVVILTRGYKSGLSDDESIYIKDGVIEKLSLKDSHSLENIYPDEARLQSYKLKNSYIVVGASRIKAASLFLEKTGVTPDYWILDDGFQHRKIKRDKNILLLNARCPISCGMLPCGRKREGNYSIKRADFILFTRAKSLELNDKQQKVLNKYSKKGEAIVFSLGSPYFIDDKDISIDDSLLKEYNVIVMCGISQPKRFIDMLLVKYSSINIVDTVVVRDHARFKKDMMFSFNKNKDSLKKDIILTTEKDYFRDPEFFKSTGIKTALLPLKLDLKENVIENFLI